MVNTTFGIDSVSLGYAIFVPVVMVMCTYGGFKWRKSLEPIIQRKRDNHHIHQLLIAQSEIDEKYEQLPDYLKEMNSRELYYFKRGGQQVIELLQEITDAEHSVSVCDGNSRGYSNQEVAIS